MQKFISKYALAAHLALLAVAPLFLFPFFGPKDTAIVLLWMSFLTMFWLFLEPSRRIDEYLYEARRRVLRNLLVDPLVWLFALFLVIALIRWMNDGVVRDFDLSGDQWRWVIRSPAIEWLPGSSGDAGFLAVASLVAVIITVFSCRHALGKSARTMFVFLAAFFAAIAALVAIWTTRDELGVASKIAFGEAGVSSFPGTAFGVFFLASLAALAGMFEARWNLALLLFSFAVGGTFAGLWYFSSPFEIMLYSGAGVLLALISLVDVAVTRGVLSFFKFLVALIIGAAVPAAIMKAFAPPELIEMKSAVLNFDFWSGEYLQTRQSWIDFASEVWRDGNIWTGVGLGALPLYIKQNMAQDSWAVTIPSGWWHLLAERGIVGAGMIVLPCIFMMFSFIGRIVSSGVKRAFWPFVFLGLFVFSTAVVEAFFDMSFLTPEVLIPAGAFLALSASAIPPRRTRNEKNNSGE